MDSDGGNRVRVRVRDREVVKERERGRNRVSRKRSPVRGIEIGDDTKSRERDEKEVGDKYSDVRGRVRTRDREEMTKEKDPYPVRGRFKSGVKDKRREKNKRGREREEREIECERERKRMKRKNEMEEKREKDDDRKREKISRERYVIQEKKRGRDCVYGYHRIEILDDTKSHERDHRVKEKVRDKCSKVRDREKGCSRNSEEDIYRVRERFNDGVKEATRQNENELVRGEREKNKSKRESENRERERDKKEKERQGEKRENDGKEKESQRSNSEDNTSPKKRKVEEDSPTVNDMKRKIDNPPFRKNFYVEAKEISKMSSEEVFTYRKQLRLTICGKNIPKPIYTWHQSGLSTTILDTLKTLNFEKPMPIQAQALPLIMSGRDCIGVAKTGSGKTLAFILPMLMHIKDQSLLVSGDGPIGLIMAPTTEIVQQIHGDISKFIKPFGLTCVPLCGGTQIDELNRGAEIVVCTPDRMMDLLCSSDGKTTDLCRVTYLVMDEVEWMLDMGFESQITRIVRKTHPDRQTVLFSATFGLGVEMLARKVFFINPVEIHIGYPSMADALVTQLVEVRPVDQRFLRLLELLRKWYEKGKILISVDSQDKCTKLLKDLLGQGYPCLSLHGEEQSDRESIVSDFKTNACNLLVVTSIAARGLGVKELELVINYDVPHHYGHYLHLVELAGRAGRKGCAITFISEDEARYSLDLLVALKLSNQLVPDELKALADGYIRAMIMTDAEKKEEARKAMKKAQAKEYVFEEDKSHVAAVSKATSVSSLAPLPKGGVASAAVPGGDALAAAMNLVKIEEDAMQEHYEAELEINQFPENARCWVTDKKIVGPISEWTGAAITTRGQYYPPGKIVGPCDRKLYLFIEGPMENSVKMAKVELKRALENFMRRLLGANC